MNKQQQQRPQGLGGVPLSFVQFKTVQSFGKGQRRRAISIDCEAPGWAQGARLRWLPFAVEVKFPDGETYLVGHATIETAMVTAPKTNQSAG